MTREMFATVEDTVTGKIRSMKTEPFTNFNMFVLDQNLRNNSYISLINTNVWRNSLKDEYYYTANVTATDFIFRSANNLYSITGTAALSQKYYSNMEDEFGHSYNLRIGRTGGIFRVVYTLNGISDTFDSNDMGYLLRNNVLDNELQFSYNITRPFWRINSTRNNIEFRYSQLYSPRVFTRSEITLTSFTTFRKFWYYNFHLEFSPSGSDDYYEPRVDGRFYHIGKELRTSLSFGSNRNKKIYTNIRGSFTKIWSAYDQKNYSISFNPGYRLSNRFSFNHQLFYSASINDIGYVDDFDTGEIIFGKRNNMSIINTFTTSYIFTADLYLSFRLRHNWSVADYNSDYYLLNSDGSLDTKGDYSENHDKNLNTFNIDMIFNWRFAPGSDLSVVWKNSIYSDSDFIYTDFGENLSNMFNSPQINCLSLKILYYLDYQYLRKR